MASLSLLDNVATTALQALEKPQQDTKRPNILFIFTDDHAPHAIGAYLFVDLTKDFDGKALQGRSDKSAWHNLMRMTDLQTAAWRQAYGPKDKAFHEANLSGQELVRWKYQRKIPTSS